MHNNCNKNNWLVIPYKGKVKSNECDFLMNMMKSNNNNNKIIIIL